MNKSFNYGGQAVIEGVMMRGKKYMTVAVRDAKGNIVLHIEPLNARLYGSISKIPLLRGLILLWDALGLGMRSLIYSADVAVGEEEVEFSKPIAWGTVAFSLVLAVAIFFVAPLALIKLIDWFTPLPILGQHILEGIIRLIFFIIYVWAISFMEDIRRVFAYHGAEHKTINAYESGIELKPEKVAQCSTVHTRCGTSFLLIVMVISIFIFAFAGNPPLWLKILSRIVLIPVIAGIAYEILKFSAAHQENILIKIFIAPGLALQKMTTREPDLSMLEVSIASLKKLLALEELEELIEVEPVESGKAITVAS